MSQGWAARGVISTARDMHRFIEGLFAGELFASPDTLALMQNAVPTAMPALARYGIGLAEKTPGLWGHGGQTLGFESDVALFETEGISVIAWATSSHNFMGLGALSVAQELRRLEIVSDPAEDAAERLRGRLIGPVWQLLSIADADEMAERIGAPERYRIEFFDDGRFAAQADCNRVLGSWTFDGTAMSIAPGPSTLAACPPDSIVDSYVAALAAASGADVIEGRLLIHAGPADARSLLTFGTSQ
jgi:hypothetical protein